MTFYEGLQDDVYDLLTEMGQSATLTHITQGAYTPATGTVTDSTTTHEVVGISDTISDRLVNGTSILVSDREFWIAAKGLTIVPAVNDGLTIGDKDYAIIQIQPTQPADTPLMYRCIIRAVE